MNNEGQNGIRVRIGAVSPSKVRKFTTALFEKSFVASFSSAVRRNFLHLRLRVIGVFLLSFGAYSILFSLIQHFLMDRTVTDAAVVFSIAICLASIPLLLSDQSLSRGLTQSRFGSVICDYLGVRREVLGNGERLGRGGFAFIVGAVLATTSFIAPPYYTAGALLLLICFCIILTTPEAGLIISGAALLFCSTELQCALLGATLVSYVIKLIRSKRDLQLRKADIAMAVLVLCVAGGYLFTSRGAQLFDMFSHLLLMLAYFLAVLLRRDCKSVKMLCTVIAAAGGICAAVYVLAYALSKLSAVTGGLDFGFLLKSLESFGGFATGEARLVFAAVLPLCFGLALRHHDTISRATLWLCAASILTCLWVMNAYACIGAALVAVIIMLLTIGRRSVYLVLSLLLAFVVALMFIDGLGERVFDVMFSAVSRQFVGVDTLILGNSAVFDIRLICGSGFGYGEGQSLYLYLVSSIGFAGLLLFAAILVLCIKEFWHLLQLTVYTRASRRDLRRFGAIRSSADTRLTAFAPLASVIAILLCGTFANVWEYGTVFMLLWISLGDAAAYSRSAVRETVKAENAVHFADGDQAASIDLGSSEII